MIFCLNMVEIDTPNASAAEAAAAAQVAEDPELVKQ